MNKHEKDEKEFAYWAGEFSDEELNQLADCGDVLNNTALAKAWKIFRAAVTKGDQFSDEAVAAADVINALS